jgi:hypothetical protein
VLCQWAVPGSPLTLVQPTYITRMQYTEFVAELHYKRKVASSILNGVTRIFHWRSPSGRTTRPGVGSACDTNEDQRYLLEGQIRLLQPPRTLRAYSGLYSRCWQCGNGTSKCSILGFIVVWDVLNCILDDTFLHF